MDYRTPVQPIPEEIHAVLERLDTALLAEDDAGVIRLANAQARRLLGYRGTELLGRDIEDILSSTEPLISAEEDESSRAVLLRHKNGAVIPVDLHSVRLVERDMYLHEFHSNTHAGNATNVEHKQRSRLAQISRLATMGQLTSSIAHEINQPMGAITLYAQTAQRLLSTPELDKEKLTKVLSNITEQSLRAGAIIERIQNFTDTGSATEVVNLNETLAEMQHLVSSDALAHGIEVNFSLTPSEVWVRCDPHEIQQVLVNLCHNAIEAMAAIECRHGNDMLVATHRTDRFVSVTVDDQGGGIPDAEVSSLFAPFHTTKPLGTGLGLSMCKSIVEELGGYIEFEKKPDGTGSIFKFSLPIQAV